MKKVLQQQQKILSWIKIYQRASPTILPRGWFSQPLRHRSGLGCGCWGRW